MVQRQDEDWWWDEDGTWNPVGGCFPISKACKNCYAPRKIAIYQRGWGVPTVHDGVIEIKNGRPVFNGNITVASDEHRLWDFPLKWKGAKNPKLGVGRPSLMFICSESDLFYRRPAAHIRRVLAIAAASRHIGQVLTRRSRRMMEFVTALHPATVRLWRPRLWLGFSAGFQEEFDEHWPNVRVLAAEGWFIFASLAPLIGPVKLPPDFLALGQRTWVVVGGEYMCGTSQADCRDCETDWIWAIREQCAAFGIPCHLLQMSHGDRFPPDVWRRQFPRI
jgi:protein gp37